MKIEINSIEELVGLITLFLGGANIQQELQQMAKNIQDLTGAFGNLKTALTTEIEEINKKLAELQDNINANGTDADREQLFTDITDATERITGIINNPPPEPEPTPET